MMLGSPRLDFFLMSFAFHFFLGKHFREIISDYYMMRHMRWLSLTPIAKDGMAGECANWDPLFMQPSHLGCHFLKAYRKQLLR